MKETMNTNEFESRAVAVTEVAPLGVGVGTISYESQLKSGELSPEVVDTAIELFAQEAMYHDVTDTDDGCIDGRPADKTLFVNGNQELEVREILDSQEHERQKVAGGGYITTLAMDRAIHKPGTTVDEDLREVEHVLALQDVYCGAHTGEHGHDAATDCGANDKFDAILRNGVAYRDVIAANTAALLAVADVAFDESTMGRVIEGWKQTTDAEAYFTQSTGASRLSTVEDSQVRTAQPGEKPRSVTKNLAGSHNEDFIIINYRDGQTFSQAAFAEALQQSHPDKAPRNLAQAFVVDVARIVQLASTYTAEKPDDTQAALYAGVAFQLATAITLTDGSLRTFIVK